MYDTLLQLPLFQGLCKDDFTNIIERVRFHFCNYNANDVLVRQGDTCDQLIFLLDGEIASQVTDKEYGYSLTEVFRAPFIVEPYSLFGMQTSYTATYRAHSDIKILTIDKPFVLNELSNYDIFRINYLNILSSRAQSINRKLWQTHIGTLREKFVNFLLMRCQRAEGEKTLQITMEDLATFINETRINVSRLLNEMQKKELIQLKRKEIFIPALEKLTEVLV